MMNPAGSPPGCVCDFFVAGSVTVTSDECSARTCVIVICGPSGCTLPPLLKRTPCSAGIQPRSIIYVREPQVRAVPPGAPVRRAPQGLGVWPSECGPRRGPLARQQNVPDAFVSKEAAIQDGRACHDANSSRPHPVRRVTRRPGDQAASATRSALSCCAVRGALPSMPCERTPCKGMKPLTTPHTSVGIGSWRTGFERCDANGER